jgi:hypothetical protein
VDAAPTPLTASAGTAGPAGTFTGPVTTGLRLPGGVTLPGGTATIAGVGGTVVAVLLVAVALLRTRRRQPAGPGARHRHR